MSALKKDTAIQPALVRRGGLLQRNLVPMPITSAIPFCLVAIYLLSFYLHGSARIPGISKLRPDMLLALLVIASLLPHIGDRISVFSHNSSRALLLLLGWVLISLPFVEWPGSVLRGNWQPFFKAILFFFFIVLTVDTERRLKILVAIFLACQVFRVLEPLYLNLTDGYFGSATYRQGEFVDRLSGAPSDVINPNGLGFVIATCVPFLHFLLFQARGFLGKVAYLAVMPALLYAMILTMSRGGFIALLVAGWMILLQSRKKGGLMIAGLAVAVVGWGMMSDYQKERYLSLVRSDTEQSATVEGRWRGMASEFRLGLKNPIFGHGIGTTPEAKANKASGTQVAHNFYAELLIEVGLIGMILFLRFIWQVHAMMKRNLQQLSSIETSDRSVDYLRRINQALMTTFWVYVVYSINYFGLSQDYWYVLAGMAFAYSRVLEHRTMEASTVA